MIYGWYMDDIWMNICASMIILKAPWIHGSLFNISQRNEAQIQLISTTRRCGSSVYNLDLIARNMEIWFAILWVEQDFL